MVSYNALTMTNCHDLLNLVVCILLRVLDQVQGFPSNIIQYNIFPLEDGRTTETCSG
jgi:hypothetical protein